MEDGAEEFFLKPVKLADMKKLKSHLLKKKQPGSPMRQPQIQPAEPEQKKPQPQPERKLQGDAAVAGAAADGTAAAVSDCNGSSNKRKAAAAAMEQTREEEEEEGLMSPPESTKPRLSNSSLAVET